MRHSILFTLLLLTLPAAIRAQQPDDSEINARFDQLRAVQRFGTDYLVSQPRMLFFPVPDSFRPDPKLPKKARENFEKGNKALQKNDFAGAKKHFAEAIAAAPDFSVAHLNLGVAEMNLQELGNAQQEFETVVKLDPQIALAHQNLGVLEIQKKNFAAAELPLRNANRLAPKDMKTLTLLAFAEALNHEYDSAIATARRVHLEPDHAGYAYAHMIAGTALQSSGRIPEALAEYELFLKENPKDPRADVARKVAEELRAGTVPKR